MEFVSDVGLGSAATIRKFDKEIQTESSMMSRETQTSISLVNTKYDLIFESIGVLDELVSEVLFKKQLMKTFNEGDLSEIGFDDDGIDQEVLSNKMRRMASADAGWNDDTLSPPKLEKISSFNTVLQFNKLMKSETSIAVKSQPGQHALHTKDYSVKAMASESPNLAPGFSNPSESPLQATNQPVSRPDVKPLPMFSIKVTKPLSEKQDPDGLSADPSPLATPKNINRNKFALPSSNMHNVPETPEKATDHDSPPKEFTEYQQQQQGTNGQTKDNEQPVQSPATPTLGPVPTVGKGPVLGGFTLHVNKVEPFVENGAEGSDEMCSMRHHQSSPPKQQQRTGVAHQGQQHQGFLEVAQGPIPGRRTSDVTGGQATHDKESHVRAVLKRSATRDLAGQLDSPGVLSLVQQLTFEMNKTSVLSSKLQRAKDRLGNKDSELEKLGVLVHVQKEDIEKKSIEIQELMQEIERLRSKMGAEKEPEEDPHLSPDKKKDAKKHKPANKEENRKLIQDYQQKLSPEQQNKANSQAKALIALLNKGVFSTFKSPMSLKTVMRTINTLTADRAAEIRQKPETRHQPFAQFIYTYYLQVFGIQQISEKKFTYFVLSLKMYGQYFRVNMFSRFIGLLEGHRVDEELILKYMEALEYMEKSNKGFPIKNKETAVKILYPFIRADEYCKYFFDGKITSDEIYNFRQSIDKLKEPDQTGMNTAVIDFDIFMDKVLERYNMILNRNKQYVLDAFKACDLDGNNTCTVNEFILLNRYLEPTNFELNWCVKSFFDHADIVDTKDTGMSFDRFAIVCTNLNLFSEKSQNSFLGISNSSEIRDLFAKVKEEWRSSCERLLKKLREFKSLIPEEVESWRNILMVLNQRMEQEQTKDLKPTLIAYFMTEKEFTRIKEEDEEANQSDDEDLVQAINKKLSNPSASDKSSLPQQHPMHEEEDLFSERMRSATKRHTLVRKEKLDLHGPVNY